MGSQKKYVAGVRKKKKKSDDESSVEESSSSTDSSSTTSLSEIYDPAFLLPLLLDFLSPAQFCNVKKFVQRHCLAFLLAATSSHFQSVRLVAYAALGRFERHLEGSRFAERNLYQRFLVLLKNSLEKPGARIPPIVSAFFARASLILLSPEDEMYCDVCNFILLKPVMDLENIPEYYRLFNSSNPLKYSKDRLWITELMSDGLVEKWDYIIYEKRQAIRVLEALLLSEFSTEVSSKWTIVSLEILREATKIPRACFELVLEHNLLASLPVLAAKFSANAAAMKIVTDILTTIWKTIDTWKTLNDVQPGRIDSLAAAYLRSVFACLEHCLKCEDAASVRALTMALRGAFESIDHCSSQALIVGNAVDAIKALVDYGIQDVKSAAESVDDEFVDAILELVIETELPDLRADDCHADLLKRVCELFIVSRHSKKPWVSELARRTLVTNTRIQNSEGFLTWLFVNEKAAEKVKKLDAEELVRHLLTTAEKIVLEGSRSDWNSDVFCFQILFPLAKAAGYHMIMDNGVVNGTKEFLMELSS